MYPPWFLPCPILRRGACRALLSSTVTEPAGTAKRVSATLTIRVSSRESALPFLLGPDHKTVWRGGFANTRPVGNDNLESDISSGEYALGFRRLGHHQPPI